VGQLVEQLDELLALLEARDLGEQTQDRAAANRAWTGSGLTPLARRIQ
jgi:hypothetical protein